MRGLCCRSGAVSLEKSGTSKAPGATLGKSDKPLPFGVDDDLAVFLGERSDSGVLQDVEHDLRGAAKAGADRSLDEWPVQQDRVRLDGFEQLAVALGGIRQA